MQPRFGFAVALAVTALPVSAQDYLGQASDSLASAGQFAGTVGVNSHLRGSSRHAQANRRGGATQRQAIACAQKSRFRAQHGGDDPRVRRLYSLCRGVGL